MSLSDFQIDEITEGLAEGEPDLLVAPLLRLPASLPASWGKVLTARDSRLAVLKMWKPIADRLPRVYIALSDRLQGIAFLRTEESGASLIYIFQHGPSTVVFRGYPPIEQDDSRRSHLPDGLGDFYCIHDGWVHGAEDGEGPRPLNQWVPMEYLWDVNWQLPPGEVSLGETAAFFKSGNLIAFGYDQSASPWRAVVLSRDGKVEEPADIWLAIDDAIGEVIETFDLVRGLEKVKKGSNSGGTELMTTRCDSLLQRIAAGPLPDGRFPGAAYHQQWSRLLLERAYLETQASGVVQQACNLYRDSLAKWCAHLERSSSAMPQDLLDYHALAHALGCEGDAAFVGSAPATMWGDGSLEAHQAYALFALERGEFENGAITAGQLLELTLEGDANPSRYDEIVCRLLESLSQRDARAFQQWRERAVGEQPHVVSAYATWITWDIRIAAFDAVACRLGLVNHVNRPLVPH